jgi:DNA modification methylase
LTLGLYPVFVSLPLRTNHKLQPSIWLDIVERHKTESLRELAKRVIEYYSYKGDTVIDIFTGSGQTNLAAELLGREHIGIDTQEKYIEYAVKRINN